VLKHLAVTTNEVAFNYDFQGKTREKKFETPEVSAYNFEEVKNVFTAEQLVEIDSETTKLLTKMNSVRTTADRPNLKKEDCLLVRHLSSKSLN